MPKKNNHRQWVAASGLGMEMCLGMGMCVFGLRHLFLKLNWPENAGIILGVMLGLGYGGYQLWKFIRMTQTPGDQDKHP